MNIVAISKEDLIEIIDERLKIAIEELIKKMDIKPTEYISRLDLAKKFNKSPESIDKWEKLGYLPPSIKMGAKKYFILNEVEEMVKSNR